jgi:DNA-binding MarR family transcriptional regulator
MNYYEFFKQLNTVLRCGLTNSEFHTLLFIGERTIRYNKVEEKIPLRHFLSGVFDGSGSLLIGRIGISKRSLLSAIDGLSRRGLVAVTQCRETGANIYRVLLTNIEKAVAMIKEASARPNHKWFRNKEISSTDENGVRGCKIAPRGVQNSTSKVTDRKPTEEKKLTSLPSSTADAAEPVQQTIDRIKLQHLAKLAGKRKTLSLAYQDFDPTALKAAWVTACDEHKDDYAGVCPYVPASRRELAIFRNTLKGLQTPNGFDAVEFVEWCVAYWKPIREERFYWMTQPPAPLTPDQRFFMRFIKDFFTLFISRYAKQCVQRQRTALVQREGLVSKAQYDKERKRAEAYLEESNRLKEQIEQEQIRARDIVNRVLSRAEAPNPRLQELERQHARLQQEFNKLSVQLYGEAGTPDEDLPEYDALPQKNPRRR